MFLSDLCNCWWQRYFTDEGTEVSLNVTDSRDYKISSSTMDILVYHNDPSFARSIIYEEKAF